MDNILKGIVIAAGVLLTIILVGIGFYIARETKNTSNNGMSQINAMNKEGQDIDISIYDGLSVSGSEVINIMDQCKNKKLFMCVKTKACLSEEGVYYNYSYTDDELQVAGNYAASEASKEDKINKMGQFKCSVYKNKLEVITGMYFVQK